MPTRPDIKRVFQFFCVCVLLACSSLVLQAASAQLKEHRFGLSKHGAIKLQFSQDWEMLVSRTPPDIPPTVKIQPREGDWFSLKITPIWSPKEEAKAVSAESVRAIVEGALKKTQVQCDGTLTLRQLEGGAYPGYYYFATDKAPKPGEYPYMLQGVLAVDELTVTFTALLRSDKQEDIESCLQVLRTMTHLKSVPSAGAFPKESAARNVYRIPKADWSLSFLGPKLKVSAPQTAGNGKNFRFESHGRGMMVTLFFEVPARKGSHKECADYYWRMGSKNPMIDKASITREDKPGYSKVEYVIVAELGGRRMALRHANYYVSYGGKWIDLHVSCPGSDEAYAKSVLALIDESLECEKVAAGLE